ncbi:MAG: hypothetical protein QG652_1325 [Pseudomonadota bacterium]|nr:hypothetical protein [Pseudomonadota bacterium]
MQMKERFLNAIISGELGSHDESGVVVTLKEFKSYFSDLQTGYINSFLPAAVIEAGQYSVTNTKYLFRVKTGVYRVHPDAMAEQIKLNVQKRNVIEESASFYIVGGYSGAGECGNPVRITPA